MHCDLRLNNSKTVSAIFCSLMMILHQGCAGLHLYFWWHWGVSPSKGLPLWNMWGLLDANPQTSFVQRKHWFLCYMCLILPLLSELALHSQPLHFINKGNNVRTVWFQSCFISNSYNEVPNLLLWNKWQIC